MNKRIFYRFNLALDVRYRILESLKPYEMTATQDMCESGIRINLPEQIEPETRLELTIKIPGETRPLMAIGRVVWVKKDALESNFATGIHLVYIKEKDRQRFYKYAVLQENRLRR